MKRATCLVVVLMCLPMLALAMPADEDSEDLPIEVREAHENLRDAVKTILEYHRKDFWPGAHVDGKALQLIAEDTLFDLRKPRLGVVIDDSDEPQGVKVLGVTPGGPADEAGLRAGDVILAINGISCRSDEPTDTLIDIVRELEKGETVTVDYLRDGTPGSVAVTVREMELGHLALDGLAAMPHFKELFADGPMHLHRWSLPHGWWKVELVSLNRELGEYFGSRSGVLVVRGSEDDALPLKGGDVILSIGGREVNSPTHAMRILGSYAPGERLSVEVMRRGDRLTLESQVPEQGTGSDD